MTSVEVWEARNPWIVEELELAADSGGPGTHRGGIGANFIFRFLEDTHITSSIDRSRTAPWGLPGGGDGRPNGVSVTFPDGSMRTLAKDTDLPKRSILSLRTGGGGGYGAPAGRGPAVVRRDLRDGYISADHARQFYPHAQETGEHHEK